jgi:hypothetical protein
MELFCELLGKETPEKRRELLMIITLWAPVQISTSSTDRDWGLSLWLSLCALYPYHSS